MITMVELKFTNIRDALEEDKNWNHFYSFNSEQYRIERSSIGLVKAPTDRCKIGLATTIRAVYNKSCH